MLGGSYRPAHTVRLSRDLADLFSHDFSCSLSCLVPEPGEINFSLLIMNTYISRIRANSHSVNTQCLYS